VVVLERVHRFAADSAIATLADAVRTGDTDGALGVLADPDHLDVTRVDPADPPAMAAIRAQVVDNAAAVTTAALAGDAAVGLERTTECKVLCATRFGPLGRDAWRDRVERHLVAAVAGFTMSARWYVGRPVIMTRNDYLTGVSNGDTGLVVHQDEGPVVAMAHRDGLRTLSPSQLDSAQTWWSMTIHKSQGSEFDHAVVSLPDRDSPVLTRELLYTAITRGRSRVTVVATEAAIRAAVDRPVARASGLADRLWSTGQR
jgi:exodeoxyribonuclease V alpha subunit